MATFQLYKQNDRVKQAIYRHPDNGASIRIPKRAFAGDVPTTLDVSDPPGGWGAGSARVGRVSNMPADIKEAADKLAAFRKQQRDERLAAMSPQERAEYERKAKERNDRLAKGRANKGKGKSKGKK